MASAEQNQEAQAKLGLWDAVSIILGIIIGAGIYETPPRIMAFMGDPWVTLGLWALCGLLALIGALCYAELATAYPRSGGDYVYITRAFGPLPGYLFGWSQLAVIQTGSIGLMAYIFARYAHRLNEIMKIHDEDLFGKYTLVVYAASAIVVISLLNMVGVVLGKIAQNILTFAKIVGLGAIVVAGFVYPSQETYDVHLGTIKEIKTSGKVAAGDKKAKGSSKGQIVLEVDSTAKTYKYDENTKFFFRPFGYAPSNIEFISKKDKAKDADGNDVEKDKTVKILTPTGNPEEAIQVMTVATEGEQFGSILLPTWDLVLLALVLVFLTYGGWSDAAFVAAEVRNLERNIPRALIIGTLGVIAIYVAVNFAYINGLGFERAQVSRHVAADMLSLLPGDLKDHGERTMCILVMISALGAINGLIYTSSRIYSTMGKDYSLFKPLGQWNKTLGTPIWSLLLQMIIALSMVAGVGTDEGQRFLNKVVDRVLGASADGKPHLNWVGESGFDSLVKCTAPIFWIFFLMTGMAIFILRINDPQIPRPFRVPLFPLLPLIFCATCGLGLYSGIGFSGKFGLVGLLLVALGLPFYVFSRRTINTDTHGTA